jgi:hypothetical protein
MNDLEDQLADAFERLADRAPHHPDLAGTARQRARRRRVTTVTGLAVASAAAVAIGLLVMPNGMFNDSKDTSNVAVTAAPPCRTTVTKTVLPEWARGGFSDPEPVMPFVTSASGNVVAILFGNQLSSPPRADIANKVLWVWHQYPTDLNIHASARLDGTGPVITAGLPTPAGPSYVDLPSPGCWRLTLSWTGGSDTIDLRVLTPQEAARRS